MSQSPKPMPSPMPQPQPQAKPNPDTYGRTMPGNSQKDKSKDEVKPPGFDVAALSEAFYRAILFLRSPQGIVLMLSPTLVWIAWSNVQEYPPVLRMIGISKDQGVTTGTWLYWALIQALQLLGGIHFASNTLKAAGFLHERGKALPDTDPRSIKLAHLRERKLKEAGDSQKTLLLCVSAAVYIYDIATIALTRGQIISPAGAADFGLIFQVAWITTMFDFLAIVIVLVGENIPNRTVRDFLGALRRGDVIKLPGKIGDWENPYK